MNIFIDTEIWSFSQKVPEESKFSSKIEYEKSLNIHKKSSKFLSEQIKKNQIYMTYHQISEIYHVLGYRGVKIPINLLISFCSELLSSKLIKFFSIDENHIKKAIELSVQSKIHVWDYLCVLPLIEETEILYSCDKHFTDPTFQNLGPKIVNPINEWIVL